MRHIATRNQQHRMDQQRACGEGALVKRSSIDDVDAPRTSRTFEVAFDRVPSRVGQMRRITDAFLQLWDVRGPLAEDIVLVVSELVTNAVVHGTDRVRLHVRFTGDGLRVEVNDGNPAPATPRASGEDDVSGRGLLLLTVLAHTWGTSDDGRATWCEFRVPETAPETAPGTVSECAAAPAPTGRA